jgi:hypothetical protein
VFSTYSPKVLQAGAMVVADTIDGHMQYWFNGSNGVYFGNTRSSAAVDRDGCECPFPLDPLPMTLLTVATAALSPSPRIPALPCVTVVSSRR